VLQTAVPALNGARPCAPFVTIIASRSCIIVLRPREVLYFQNVDMAFWNRKCELQTSARRSFKNVSIDSLEKGLNEVNQVD